MTGQAWPPSNAWAMKGKNLIRNLSVAFSGAKEHHPGTRNHEVAHERPHREADRTGRAGLPRLARTHRPPRVRRMVPGQARGPLRPRPGTHGPHHLPRLRAQPLAQHGPGHGPGATDTFHPASVRNRRSEEHTSELQSLMRTSY